MGERWKPFLRQRLYFSSENEAGGVTCYRPFIMVAQTTRLKIKRSDVPAVFLAARPYLHKCLVAPCLSSNPPTDGSASSEMQNFD